MHELNDFELEHLRNKKFDFPMFMRIMLVISALPTPILAMSWEYAWYTPGFFLFWCIIWPIFSMVTGIKLSDPFLDP